MTDDKTKEISNREVKSDVFTTYFSVPENAAQLYSALAGEEVSAGDIEIRTLEGVLFLVRKNDLGFTVKDRVLVISEHQSTLNANMPLRCALYYGRTMEKLVSSQDLYRRKRIPIPTPEFFMFYNGDESVDNEKILKLSDAYIEKTDHPMLELKVKMININLPAGHAILRKCEPLYEYSWFMQRIKTYLEQEMHRDAAITQTIKDCVREGIFAEFVREHGSEVENMLFTQFNLEDAKKVWCEEWYEDGVEDGIEFGKAQGEQKLLIRMVCRKRQKGKTLEEIVEELEEPFERISRICAAYEECGPDEETIYDKLQEKQ